jgi:hypothetical protein
MGPVRRCPPLWPTCWCRADAVSDAAPRGQCRTPCLGSATVSDISHALTGCRTAPGVVGQVGGHVSARFINVSVPPVGSCPDLWSHFPSGQVVNLAGDGVQPGFRAHH